MESYLKKRIKHLQKRVLEQKELHGENPTEKYNYYGGQTLGYWEGRLSAFEDILDEIINGEGL